MKTPFLLFALAALLFHGCKEKKTYRFYDYQHGDTLISLNIDGYDDASWRSIEIDTLFTGFDSVYIELPDTSVLYKAPYDSSYWTYNVEWIDMDSVYDVHDSIFILMKKGDKLIYRRTLKRYKLEKEEWNTGQGIPLH